MSKRFTFNNVLYLAVLFRDELSKTLDLETLREVDVRNATPEYATACASHDFCDANDAMCVAWERHFKASPDVTNDSTCDTMNAAWDVARWRGFASAEPIPVAECRAMLRSRYALPKGF